MCIIFFPSGVLLDACDTTPDCSTSITNSICDPNICICDSDYLSDGTLCLPRNLNDACDNDAQCVFGVSANTICDSSQCKCETGYIDRNTAPDETCESRLIDDVCAVDIDCTTNIDFSECLSTFCKCITGYDVSADRTQCNAKELGDDCVDDTECTTTITLSACEGSICVCPDGHIEIDSRTCKLRQIHTDECTNSDTDCVPAVANSECESLLCECISGYIVNDLLTDCTLRILGDQCTTDTDCLDAITNSECTDSTCSCLLGYIADGTNVCNAREYCISQM